MSAFAARRVVIASWRPCRAASWIGVPPPCATRLPVSQPQSAPFLPPPATHANAPSITVQALGSPVLRVQVSFVPTQGVETRITVYGWLCGTRIGPFSNHKFLTSHQNNEIKTPIRPPLVLPGTPTPVDYVGLDVDVRLGREKRHECLLFLCLGFRVWGLRFRGEEAFS